MIRSQLGKVFWGQLRGAGCWGNVPGKGDRICKTWGVGSPEELPKSVAGPQQVGSYTGSGLGRRSLGEKYRYPQDHHIVDPGHARCSANTCHITKRACRQLCWPHVVLAVGVLLSPNQKRSPLSHIYTQ